jgi:hypothetical protein
MKLKTVVTVVLVCGSLASLGGCASMRGKGDSRDLASSLSDDPANPVDLAYVTQINQEAERHSGVVLWVHPPHEDTRPQGHN